MVLRGELTTATLLDQHDSRLHSKAFVFLLTDLCSSHPSPKKLSFIIGGDHHRQSLVKITRASDYVVPDSTGSSIAQDADPPASKDWGTPEKKE